VPIERSGYMPVQMWEVSKLAKVENLRRTSWLIVEAHHDRVQVGLRANDRLNNAVTLSARAHWSVR
jgi:hypothetical protein